MPFIFLFSLFIKLIYSSPFCKESENYCIKCNILTNLCFKCQYDNLIPDDKGGCIGAKKCVLGKNYCIECDTLGELCNNCEDGYFPDKNGGCSYTNNCKLSNKGECLECDDNYILIGKELELKICKSKNIDDFKNCIEINKENGECLACEDGYFLNTGDKKCTKTEYCSESIFGNCISCYIGYYLNKPNNTCLLKINNFLYCEESLDGVNCDKCDEISYLDERGDCALSNYCSESLKGKCQKCIQNYYLSSYISVCSLEKNCYKADKDTGVCLLCEDEYYLDMMDYKCKSNRKDNDLKYCQKVNNDLCIECINGYKLSKDLKCTLASNCLEAENGKCISCEENYYLGLDNRCSRVEHCIYSSEYRLCLECEDNYYFNTLLGKCVEAKNGFENCKISAGFYCSACKKNFYLNYNESKCMDNSQEGPFYKCALSDSNNEFCVECIDNYYIGTVDNKCSLIENCKISQDENTCIECDEYYCLDVKKGICVENDFIYDEENLFYFACNKTNKEGTACEICMNGYEVGEGGYCVDASRCLEKKDGECSKCIVENDFTYCANKYFGCVENVYDNCLRCDDLLDLYKCTECIEGYQLTSFNACVKIE